jgi:hypothetical protein
MSERGLTGRNKGRFALSGLTVVCVVAHAVVIGGLSGTGRSAPVHVAGALATMQIQIVPMPSTQVQAPQPELDVPTSSASRAQAVAQRAGPTPESPSRPLSAQKPALDVPALATIDAAADRFLPTSVLDIRPMPRSAPDESRVEHVHKSGVPIRVRLYVESTGFVSSGDILSVAPGDEESAEQLIAMFRDTAFSPGRLQGREVASFIDLEIVLEPKLPDTIPVVRY